MVNCIVYPEVWKVFLTYVFFVINKRGFYGFGMARFKTRFLNFVYICKRKEAPVNEL